MVIPVEGGRRGGGGGGGGSYSLKSRGAGRCMLMSVEPELKVTPIS